jgi:hypothetical protein
VADGERMNPKGKCAFAPTKKTKSTRATSTPPLELLRGGP